jgi:threonine dehydratase
MPSNNWVSSAADVDAAAERLRGVAVRTPFCEWPVLNETVGGRVLLKLETFQITGTFKFRGAYNRLCQVPAEERGRGVVAWSSGNHAQGVAAAAQLLGMPATIVMPADAPLTKIEGTRGLGAEIVFYDRQGESREEIGARLARERGAILLPSYDDPDVIAGQGTVGLEIAEQAAALGIALDQAFVCCGGGGLAAGTALALTARHPSLPIFSVEPAQFDDTRRSLESGARVSVATGAKSFCDALLTPTPGALTFPINQGLLAGGLSVTDQEVARAMRFAFRALKLVIEPGGAVSLAAALAQPERCAGKTTAVVVSGGNVDADLFAQVIAAD